MSIQTIEFIEIDSNTTFQDWLNTTNDIIDLIRDSIVTTSISELNPGITSGHLSVTGSISSPILKASNSIRTDRITSFTSSANIQFDNTALFRNVFDTRVAIFRNSNGPRTLFQTNTSEWSVGLNDSSGSDFRITTGVGDPLLKIETTGVVTIRNNLSANNISVSGNTVVEGTSTSTAGFIGNLTGIASRSTRLNTDLTVNMTGPITWSISFNGSEGSVTAASIITNNAVTNDKLRTSVGLSIIGRSVSTTGNVADITAASDHQILRRSGASIGFGAINLSMGAAITGVLPVSNGGTGASSFTSSKLIIGNGTSAPYSETNLHWNNASNRLGINTSAPDFSLDVAGSSRITGNLIVTSGQLIVSNISTTGIKPNAYVHSDGRLYRSTTAIWSTGESDARYIQKESTSDVLTATAGAAAGAVGTYAFMSLKDTSALISPNSTRPGSQLNYHGVNVPESGSLTAVGGGVPEALIPGTWRAMGGIFEGGSGGSRRAATLFLRIS